MQICIVVEGTGPVVYPQSKWNVPIWQKTGQLMNLCYTPKNWNASGEICGEQALTETTAFADGSHKSNLICNVKNKPTFIRIPCWLSQNIQLLVVIIEHVNCRTDYVFFSDWRICGMCMLVISHELKRFANVVLEEVKQTLRARDRI